MKCENWQFFFFYSFPNTTKIRALVLSLRQNPGDKWKGRRCNQKNHSNNWKFVIIREQNPTLMRKEEGATQKSDLFHRVLLPPKSHSFGYLPLDDAGIFSADSQIESWKQWVSHKGHKLGHLHAEWSHKKGALNSSSNMWHHFWNAVY